MNTENLKQLINELTDIIYVERRVIFTFIGLTFLIKLVFYVVAQKQLNGRDDFKIVHSPKLSTMKSFVSKEATATRLFPFDPHTIRREELLGLGFSPRVADILINYRTKGGKFRTKEDVKKIYGVSPELYRKIEPYIHIESDIVSHVSDLSVEKSRPSYIDINTASKEDWKSLPGIGDYFATKLTEKREKLGTFVSIEQVGEIYNLPDSTFQKIRPYLKLKEGNIRKININTAKEEELRRHPYILRWQADEILRNRPIFGLEDLYDLKTYRDRTKNQFVGSYFEF